MKNIFLAKTKSGVDEFFDLKKSCPNIELWVNGGIDIGTIDIQEHNISIFSISFDFSRFDHLQAALGTIEEHYQCCKIWVES